MTHQPDKIFVGTPAAPRVGEHAPAKNTLPERSDCDRLRPSLRSAGAANRLLIKARREMASREQTQSPGCDERLVSSVAGFFVVLRRAALSCCVVAVLLATPSANAGFVMPAELAGVRSWAAAKFEAAAPQRPGERAAYPADPPFSFIYGGKPSTELLKGWKCERASRKLDGQRTGRTLVWTDPQTGLQVRCVAVEYDDFPTVEWTLYFKNTGAADSPILSDIQAVDLLLTRAARGEFVLNQNAGDNCAPDSYEPRRLTLSPKSEHRFAPAGGRPTSVGFPYFNLEWPGEGLIVVIGWPGQWAARFTRDEGNGLRVRGGQELTHFKLRPGEEVRSPLVVLQFWQGDRVRAQNIWRRWMLAHNSPRDRDGKTPRPILTSCSGGFFPGIRTSEAGERQFITAFHQADVKLDYWWIDAGWYRVAAGIFIFALLR